MIEAPAVPMAFDERVHAVVAVVDDHTWTFDVETLTWARRSAVDFGRAWFWTRLVYDPATDLTVAVTQSGATYVYDASKDTWTPRAPLPEPGGGGVAALDTRTGRVVVLTSLIVTRHVGTVRAWSYSVADDAWDEIGQTGHAPTVLAPLLIGYAPTVNAFVAVTGGHSPEPLGTYTFAPEPGVWEEVAADTPRLEFTWGDLSSGTEMVYAPVTDRLSVFTNGVVAEYDPVERTWRTFTAPDTTLEDGVPVGDLVRFGATVVYDSVNERVVMYSGRARTSDGWALLDDVWAYDPIGHEWSRLLNPSQRIATQ